MFKGFVNPPVVCCMYKFTVPIHLTWNLVCAGHVDILNSVKYFSYFTISRGRVIATVNIRLHRFRSSSVLITWCFVYKVTNISSSIKISKMDIR